jgi:cell shape-determining protein MreC
MVDDMYNEPKENSLKSMIGDFYNRQNTSSIIFVWVVALILVVMAVLCGRAFFMAPDTRTQILFATFFLIIMGQFQFLRGLVLQASQRNSIQRELKRLELHIAELGEAIREHSK